MSEGVKLGIAPMLSVSGGSRAVEFYKAAFGAEELLRMGDESIVAKLAVGEAEFWVADESPKYRNFSPESLGGSTVRIVLTVDDPDASFARAVEAGARVISPLADREYGWRDGRVEDPFGHQWEIGRPIR